MSFSWLGRALPRIADEVFQSTLQSPEAQRRLLVRKLQLHLYAHFYVCGFVSPLIAAPFEENRALNEPSFVRELSVANVGTGSFSEPCEVRRIPATDQLVIRRGGLDIWVRRDDCVTAAAVPICPGVRIRLRVSKEDLDVSPGFYVALGDRDLHEDSHPIVRLYWNVTPPGALRFVRHATIALNRAGLPFKIKVVNRPDWFTRRDALVLYTRQADYPGVARLMADLYGEMADSVKVGVPAFTKELAIGVGVAEDPANGESFGSHRCRIFAEGLIRAYEQRRTSDADRLRAVRECFEDNGIPWQRPYVNSAGVADQYEFPLPLKRSSGSGARQTREESARDPFVPMAVSVGDRLVRNSIWHENHCTWIGAADAEFSRPLEASYGTLAPDFYAGTSGIAVFLAELHSFTQHEGAKRCAVGAIRQALSRLDHVAVGIRSSLYTGWAGIALAAAWVGRMASEPEFLEVSAALMRRAVGCATATDESDILAGRAGTLAATLAIRNLVGDDSLLALSVTLGDELLEAAERGDDVCSWPSASSRTRRNLTGFAHGAAGIGFALLELFHATGRANYRKAAESAFNYERLCFDAQVGNWPDFRLNRGSTRRSHAGFSIGWCHGAPGIALSRIRAYHLLKDPWYRTEALTALATTLDAVRRQYDSFPAGHSLCHGVFGLASVLLHGSRVLGPDFPEGEEAARQVFTANIRDDCLDAFEDRPGLMLGIAGIGHFCLQLQGPVKFSPLEVASDCRFQPPAGASSDL
jgi:hypothetical protein